MTPREEKSPYRIESRIEEMRARWRKVVFTRGLAAAAAAAVVALALAAAVDYVFELEMAGRYGLALACYLGITLLVYWRWFFPYRKPLSREGMAWMLEDARPELNERLISSVELSGDPHVHMSSEMVERLLEEAEVDLYDLHPVDVFPMRWSYFRWPALLGCVFLVAMGIPGLQMPLLVKRVLLPRSSDARPGAYPIEVVKPLPGRRVEGDAVQFAVRLGDPRAREADLFVQDNRLRSFPMAWNASENLCEFTLDKVLSDFTFWVRSGRGLSERRLVKVAPRPKVEEFTLTYEYPAFSRLEPARQTSRSGDLKALKGTRATLVVRASKVLEKMEIDGWGPKTLMRLSEGGRVAEYQGVIEKSGSYRLFIRDAEGLMPLKEPAYRITALEDEAPTVVLERPDSDQYVSASDTLQLSWVARDDFAVERQELRWSRFQAAPQIVALSSAAGNHEFALASTGAQEDEVVTLSIKVYDGSGHSGESKKVLLTMTRSANLKNAEPFVAACREWIELTGLEMESLKAAEELRDHMREKGAGASEDRVHDGSVLDARVEEMGRLLEGGEETLGRVEEFAFFSKAAEYSGLVRRYAAQERVAALPAIAVPGESGSGTRDFRDMLDLGRKMVEGLMSKGRHHVLKAEGRRMRGRFEVDKERKDAVLRDWREKLKDFGEFRDLSTLPSRQDSERPAAALNGPGLWGRYYLGKVDYVTPEERAQRKPDREVVDAQVNFLDISSVGMGQNAVLAAFWKGFVRAPVAGAYTFFANSDDGARVYIDGQWVVNNDGGHAIIEKSGTLELKEGLHSIELWFFNWGGPGGVQLLWQAPGRAKEVIPGDFLLPVVPVVPQGESAPFDIVLAELDRRIQDYRELDLLAESIRAKLANLEERLRRLARDLDSSKSDTASLLLQRAGAELEKQAKTSQDLKERADLEMAAEFLKETAAKKDGKLLEKAAPEIQNLVEAHAARHAKGGMDAKLPRFAAAMEQWSKRMEDPAARGEIQQQMEGMRRELEQELAQRAAGPRQGKAADSERQIAEAARGLEDAQKAMLENRLPDSKNRLAQVKGALEQSQRDLDEMLITAEVVADRSRERMEALQGQPSERLGQALQKLAALPPRLAAADPSSVKGVREAQHELEDAGVDLAKIANALQRDAEREIADARGDARAAKEKLALAAAIEKADREHLGPARARLQGAAERTAEQRAQEGEGRRSELSPETLAANRKDLAGARAEVEQAIAELQNTASLAAAHEKAEDARLSHAEEKQQREQMAKVAEELLPVEVVQEMARLEDVRAARQDVEQLAGESARLEKQPNAQQNHELAGDVAQKERELAALAGEKPPRQEPQGPQGPLTPQAAPQPQAQPNRDVVRNVLNRVEEHLTNAAASQKAAEGLENRLRSDARKAQETLEAMEPAEGERRGDWEKAVGELNKGNYQAAGYQARSLASRLQGFPEQQQKLNQLASELDQSQQRVNERNQRRGEVHQHDQQALAEAGPAQSELAKARGETGEAAQHAFERLKADAMADEPEKALAVLEALRKDFAATGKEDAAGSENGPPAQQGMNRLAEAKRRATPARQPLLDQAQAAAQRGDFAAAEKLARQAAEPLVPEAQEAQALEEAGQAQSDEQNLKRALEEGRQNHFAAAGEFAAQTDGGEKAAALWMEAKAKVDRAAMKAIERSGEIQDPGDRSILDNAARVAARGDLQNAANAARNSKKEGKELLRAIAEAQELNKQAEKEVQKAMKEAHGRQEKMAKQAQKGMDKSLANTGRPGLGKPEQDLMRDKLQQARSQAQGDLKAAAENARAAAQGATEAMEAAQAFAAAQAAQGQPEGQGKPGVPQQGQQADAGAQTAQGQPEGQGKTGDAQQGQQTDAGAQAQGQPPGQGKPGDPQQGQPAGRGRDSARESFAHEKIAAAKGDLHAARDELNKGAANPKSTGSLKSAAAALAAIEEQARAAALAASQQLAEAKSGQQGAAQPDNGQSGKPGEQGGKPNSNAPSGEGGKQDDKSIGHGDGAVDLSQLRLGDSWQGVEGGIEGAGAQGQRNTYSDYYRRANQRYLELLTREGRKGE